MLILCIRIWCILSNLSTQTCSGKYCSKYFRDYCIVGGGIQPMAFIMQWRGVIVWGKVNIMRLVFERHQQLFSQWLSAEDVPLGTRSYNAGTRDGVKIGQTLTGGCWYGQLDAVNSVCWYFLVAGHAVNS